VTKPKHSLAARPAVFLDRDGVLNEEVNYLYRIEDLVWVPGAREAVRRLNGEGYLVLVITNQAGIAHGYFTEEDMHRLHAHMQRDLELIGAHVDAFYHSPYHPKGSLEAYRRESNCRKPGTELFERAIREWDIDPEGSYVIGDKNTDIEPGRLLGIKTILVETGYGRSEKESTKADFVVTDLTEAVELILADDKRTEG
jgi:D-glycero-D-manno-heptose 1,7-bisphosphate phosphatase